MNELENYEAYCQIFSRGTDEEKERLIREASNRITGGEVWVLGTLAHLGHLVE